MNQPDPKTCTLEDIDNWLKDHPYLNPHPYVEELQRLSSKICKIRAENPDYNEDEIDSLYMRIDELDCIIQQAYET